MQARARAPRAALSLGVAALCLCGGCDVEFPEQEVRFRHDAQADTLDVLFVYLGVTTPDDGVSALRKGRDVVERILAGRREFMFLDWPFNFDLDQEFAEEQRPEAGVQAVLERVRLERAGAFLDDAGRLSGFQHFRLSGVSAALAEANRQIDRACLHELDTGGFPDEDLPGFDAAEERVWRDFLAARRPWVSLEQGRFVVRFPASQAGAARWLEHLARTAAETADGDVGLALLLANLSALEVSGGVATLQVGRPEGADTIVRLTRGVEYSPALRDKLTADGLDLSSAPTLAQVRASLDGPR